MNPLRRIRFAVSVLALLSYGATLWGQHTEEVDGDQIRVEEENQTPREDHPVTASDESAELQRARSLIVQKTNEFRKSKDLAFVEPSAALTEAATYFAKFMARTGKYGHTADGKRPAERATNHGYDYCIVSENIAYFYNPRRPGSSSLAAQFVEGWIESEGHRENMLNEVVTDTGVAVARDEKTGYYFSVQMFGRPKSAAIDFTIANRSGVEVPYLVITESKQRTMTLPPRVVVTHSRCRPPKVKLKHSEATALEVKSNDRFVIREDEEENVLLEKLR